MDDLLSMRSRDLGNPCTKVYIRGSSVPCEADHDCLNERRSRIDESDWDHVLPQTLDLAK